MIITFPIINRVVKKHSTRFVKKPIFYIVLLFLFLFLTSILFTSILTHQRYLLFQSSACSSIETLGVRQASWVNGSLLITAFVSVNCADQIIAGRYRIENDMLNLLYYIDDPKMDKAECECAKEITYQISNAPKKEYSIALFEESHFLLTVVSNIVPLFKR